MAARTIVAAVCLALAAAAAAQKAPRQSIGVYQFPGAEQFSYTRLLQASGYVVQQPYSAASVSNGAAGLRRYFEQEGFFRATVEPTLDAHAADTFVNVVFRVALGPRALYGDVVLAGATPEQVAYLEPSLSSWWARLRRATVLSGHRYSPAGLRNAAKYLQSELNGRGHLGAQVTLAGARYDAATNRAQVTFDVAAGPVTNVAVAGVHLWPWTRHRLLPMYSESRVDPELIKDGADNLTNYLSAQGYFQARVTTSQTVSSTGTTSIVYHVVLGARHDVEAVKFSGNQAFPAAKLDSQVTVKPEGILFFHRGKFSRELLRESVTNVTNFYQASGFSDVVVTPHITLREGEITVTFAIHEGVRDRVAQLTVNGATVPLATLAPGGLRLRQGQPFSQDLIAADRAQVLAYYLSHGYLTATVHVTAQQQSADRHAITVVYAIHEGVQTRVAAVAVAGREHTQPRLMARATEKAIPQGDLLTEEGMLRAESELYAPGIFDWAQVGALEPITTQRQAEVVMRVHEAQRNQLTYGFGFDVTNRGGSIPSGTVAVPGLPVVGLPSNFSTSQATFWGPNGSLEYTRLNVAGKAETLSLGAFAGRLDQRGTFTYTVPSVLWSRFDASFQVSAENNEQNPLFSARDGTASFQLALPLNADATSHLFLRASYDASGLSRLLIPALVPVEDQHLRLATLSASWVRDTRDNPLDAHKGMIESSELDLTPGWLGSSASFAKALAQTAYYKNIGGGWGHGDISPIGIIWANSVRLGFTRAFSGSFVPLSQEFFTGGGSTLRGFPLDGAGPQRAVPACGNPTDPSTCTLLSVPVGGNDLLIVNSELRIPTPAIQKDLGVALFYDGGNVFQNLSLSPISASYTNSIGIGLRYQTGLGPIRIDFGHNLNALRGVKSTQIFITLGQAF